MGTKQKIHECLLKEALSPFLVFFFLKPKDILIPMKNKNDSLLLFKIIPLVLE